MEDNESLSVRWGTAWNQVGADMRGYSTSDYYGTLP